MSRGLAYRRHQEKKAKRKARERIELYGEVVDKHHLPITDKRVGRLATTPKPCSCSMCGNPRRQFGEPTLQEKSHEEITKRLVSTIG